MPLNELLSAAQTRAFLGYPASVRSRERMAKKFCLPVVESWYAIWHVLRFFLSERHTELVGVDGSRKAAMISKWTLMVGALALVCTTPDDARRTTHDARLSLG